MSKVIVFGSLNMDLSIQCARIPQQGETMDGDSFIITPGGKGANQAVAASRLGAPVSMIGAVGDDIFARELTAGLAASNIDTTHVQSIPNTASGTATIMRIDNDNRIILGHGANWALKEDDVCKVLDQIAEPEDIFLTQFECDAAATDAAIKHAYRLGMYTMLNPAPVRAVPDNVWPCVDYICVNETESEALTGILPHNEEEAREVTKAMQERGASSCVITLGAQGAYGQTKQEGAFVPSRHVTAIDTTAAGDTFIGAMAAAKIAGKDFFESMQWATGASSLTVSRLGAQQSIPWKQELDAL